MNEVSDDLGNKDDEGTHETTATYSSRPLMPDETTIHAPVES